jgi:hypothetical protein
VWAGKEGREERRKGGVRRWRWDEGREGGKEGRREGGAHFVGEMAQQLCIYTEREVHTHAHTRTICVGLMICCLVFSTDILCVHNICFIFLFILFLFAIFLLMYTSMEKEKEKEKEEGLKKRKEERGLG